MDAHVDGALGQDLTVLRLATWNVLAPAHAHPHRYAGVLPADLLAETRIPRVRSLLHELLDESDVVAVQEADDVLVAWLREEVGASVVHAPRESGRDGVLLASQSHALSGEAGASSDGRRTWASATLAGVLVVSLHLDPEWPEKRRAGAAQAAELLAWVEAREPSPVVLLGDLNAPWSGPTGDVLRCHGFEAAPCGATAATNGRTRELDVVASRGCASLVTVPTDLASVGSSVWLPDALHPSDHVPVRAVIACAGGSGVGAVALVGVAGEVSARLSADRGQP